ncbi:DUF1707 domain-containing protein [Microbispora corallina]|uniref:DUF1707 domain-containing protein n=1 Tax=Microbispora corallina TaxID=83302 RepID=A0ABQ4G4R0_9ACTN|nr:DUF1707 domain-containing protein [Microbispora corallina]GIH42060.1 hypothetical protein Mco01_50600 [Microbispora corallina]
MAAAPEMRASDGDRDRVAAALREHMAQGRLTVDEFGERLEQVYQSRTYGELAKVTSDLPEIDLHTLPATVAPVRSDGRRPADKAQNSLKASWAAWASASAINWVIWIIVSVTSGHLVYPWPLWVMGPWGAIMLVGTIFGTTHNSKRGR